MGGMPNRLHVSMDRLNEVARTRGDDAPTKIAARLNVSPQMVTNWGSRGISLGGALDAQLKYGCDANWLLGRSSKPWPQGVTTETRLDPALLRSAILVTERAIAAKRVTVTTEARTEITLGAYDMLREGQDMQSAERIVARMLQAIGGATVTS